MEEELQVENIKLREAFMTLQSQLVKKDLEIEKYKQILQHCRNTSYNSIKNNSRSNTPSQNPNKNHVNANKIVNTCKKAVTFSDSTDPKQLAPFLQVKQAKLISSKNANKSVQNWISQNIHDNSQQHKAKISNAETKLPLLERSPALLNALSPAFQTHLRSEVIEKAEYTYFNNLAQTLIANENNTTSGVKDPETQQELIRLAIEKRHLETQSLRAANESLKVQIDRLKERVCQSQQSVSDLHVENTAYQFKDSVYKLAYVIDQQILMLLSTMLHCRDLHTSPSNKCNNYPGTPSQNTTFAESAYNSLEMDRCNGNILNNQLSYENLPGQSQQTPYAGPDATPYAVTYLLALESKSSTLLSSDLIANQNIFNQYLWDLLNHLKKRLEILLDSSSQDSDTPKFPFALQNRLDKICFAYQQLVELGPNNGNDTVENQHHYLKRGFKSLKLSPPSMLHNNNANIYNAVGNKNNITPQHYQYSSLSSNTSSSSGNSSYPYNRNTDCFIDFPHQNGLFCSDNTSSAYVRDDKNNNNESCLMTHNLNGSLSNVNAYFNEQQYGMIEKILSAFCELLAVRRNQLQTILFPKHVPIANPFKNILPFTNLQMDEKVVSIYDNMDSFNLARFHGFVDNLIYTEDYGCYQEKISQLKKFSNTQNTSNVSENNDSNDVLKFENMILIEELLRYKEKLVEHKEDYYFLEKNYKMLEAKSVLQDSLCETLKQKFTMESSNTSKNERKESSINTLLNMAEASEFRHQIAMDVIGDLQNINRVLKHINKHKMQKNVTNEPEDIDRNSLNDNFDDEECNKNDSQEGHELSDDEQISS